MKTRKKPLKIVSRTLFTYGRATSASSKSNTDPTTSTITTSTITGGIFGKVKV